MAKATRLVGVALGSVLLLLVAVALLLESPWMRDWLEDQASQQVGGREVEIGDLDIGWGWPLAVQLNDVRVANASWARNEDMARLDELAIDLDPGRLIRGEVELELVRVERLMLHLARREDGTPNWSRRGGEKPPDKALGQTIWPKAFAIARGRLTYHDAAQDIELDVAFETPGGTSDELRLDVRGEGHVQDDPLTFQALAHYQRAENRVAVEELEGEIGGGRLNGSLAVDLGRDVPYIEAQLDADALDLNRWGVLDESEGDRTADGATARSGSGNEAENASTLKAAWDQRWAEALGELKAFEGQVDLSIARLRYADQTLHDLAIEGQLEDGRVSVERLHALQESADGQRGGLTIQGWIEVQERRLVADVEAQLDRVDLTAALAPLGLGELGMLDGRLNTQVVDGGLVFDDTAIDYQGPRWGLTLSLRADSREIEGLDKPGVYMVGDGTYQETPFAFDLVVGPLLDLTSDEPYPISGELNSGDTQLQLDGSVVQPLELASVEGDFRLKGPNLADISDLTGINLPEVPPYQVRSHLQFSDDLLRLNDMQGGFGNSDVAGDVRLRMEERPQLTATLTSDTLEAVDLLPMLGITPPPDTGETASPERERWTDEVVRRRRLFPDRRWDVAGLRGTDIVLDYRASNVKMQYVPFTDVSLELELERGVMTIDPLQVGLGGGQVNGTWVIDARQNVLKGDLNLALKRVSLKALLREAHLPQVAQDSLGVVGGRGDFAYRGRSMDEVMAGLNGTLELAMSQGWLDVIAAELLPLNVANALVAALTDAEQVPLECTYVHFVADDGLADLKQFFMSTEIANFTGGGAINLDAETLRLLFEGHNKDVTLFTGESPVELKGPMRNPRVNVVSRELLARGLASLLGAVVAPPAAILPWIDPGGGEDVGIGCKRAMAEFKDD
ncbi:AsmA family protein [Litchfieldella rifensis]|uniref:AsmA family protein n=1 Tax=Litchfieldella rifensis TaxID=762643 RepID=A0ABV7LS69_9GAMM